MLKKAIKQFFIAVVGIVLGLALTVLAIWLKPDLLVNGRTLPKLLQHIPGVTLTWGSLSGGMTSQSFWVKRLVLDAKDVCAVGLTAPFRVCGTRLHLTLDISVRDEVSLHVRSLELDQGDVSYDALAMEKTAPAPEKMEEPSQSLFPTPPAFLEYVHIDHVKLEVPKLAVKWEGGSAAGGVLLGLDGEAGQLRVQATADAKAKVGTESYVADLRGQIASLGTQWYGPYHGDVVVRAKGKKLSADASLAVRAAGAKADQLGFKLSADVREGKRRYVAKLEGSGKKTSWDAKLSGAASGLAVEMPKITVDKCQLALRLPSAETPQKSSVEEQAASLDCKLRATTAFVTERTSGGARKFVQEILREIPIGVRLGARMVDPKTGRVEGKASARVDTLLSGAKDGNVGVDVEFAGRLRDFPKDWRATATGDAGVKNFQALVRWLKDHPWAIPEPLASLGGSIELKTDQPANLLGENATIPLRFATRLKSKTQALIVDGDGALTMRNPQDGASKTKLTMKVTLNDVRFELPKFGLQPPPPLFPDARIRPSVTTREVQAELKNNAAPSSFDYDVEIATAVGKPIQLLTDLTKAPVPIHVDIKMHQGSPPQGYVRVGNTPATYFGHRAELRRFDLKLGRTNELTEVNGEVAVYYTDYTIRILVLGLMQKPEIKFLSEPPLPKDQIIAVLLFGRTIDGLDRDQASSVSNFSSGVADGAVTLASMYLLASTPVESIGYDMATKNFTAKVRLADGTSLNVGTDMRQLQQLGIRHRLGPHWTITTYLTHPLDPLTRSLTAFLEWSKGY